MWGGKRGVQTERRGEAGEEKRKKEEEYAEEKRRWEAGEEKRIKERKG
jgi:hypothetical protein